MSGNGKTFGVEQACAALGRELIRVNITVETDEDDLIGGFRLVNGETVWHNGTSLKHSSEVLYCSLTKSTLPLTKFSAFRASLREMEFSLRKLVVSPPGFNVFTANTKGKGSGDEDLLDKCSTSLPRAIPSYLRARIPFPKNRRKMLTNYCTELNCCDDEFTRILLWQT